MDEKEAIRKTVYESSKRTILITTRQMLNETNEQAETWNMVEIVCKHIMEKGD